MSDDTAEQVKERIEELRERLTIWRDAYEATGDDQSASLVSAFIGLLAHVATPSPQ